MSEFDGAAWLLLGRSQIRRRILALLVFNLGERYHLREIARQVSTSPGTASRELKRLLDAGLIDRTAEGRQVYYHARTYGMLYESLDYFMRRTMGVREALHRHLTGLRGVKSAAIFGSYASGSNLRPNSDVDLLVVGNPNRDDLTDRLEQTQAEIGRPINEVVMTQRELAERRRRNDAFVGSIDGARTIEVVP